MSAYDGWYTYDFEASKITQGTILDGASVPGLTSRHYVVLNPECDLAHGKSEYINLVAEGQVRGATEDILSDFNLEDAFWSGLKALPRNKLDKITKKLQEQLNGKQGPRWFFAPSDDRVGGLPLLVFDLQQIHTLDAATVPELLAARKAVINSPFKESLVTRLYSYLTRVGTDDGYKIELCYSIIEGAGMKLPEQPAVEGTVQAPAPLRPAVIATSPDLSAAQPDPENASTPKVKADPVQQIVETTGTIPKNISDGNEP